MMELGPQNTREEMEKEEEEAEETRKGGGGMSEVAVAVEIFKRNEEEAARPVTRDGEDGDLKMRHQGTTPEATGLETLQHATTAGIDNTPPC